MSDPFRRLGDVDVDLTPPPDPAPYRYGGRLPDPDPREAPATIVPAALSRPSVPTEIETPGARAQKDTGETPEFTPPK